MKRQAELFPAPEWPAARVVRPPRIKRAHMVDAGEGQPGFPYGAQFECTRCGWRSGWLCFTAEIEIRRGVPCEGKCNGGSTK